MDVIRHLSFNDGRGGSSQFKVHIPAGIDNGGVIRLAGKGYPGTGKGQPGDLLLTGKYPGQGRV